MWQILLVIIGIWVLYVTVGYLRIMAKRWRAVKRLSKCCVEKGYTLTMKRSMFGSIFFSKSKPDLTIETTDVLYRVNLLTTRFRRMTYRIVDPAKMQIMKARREVYVTNKIKPKATAGVDRVSVIRKLRLPYGDGYTEAEEGKRTENILLITPAPHELTAVSGSTVTEPGNGERLYDRFSVYYLSGFIAHLDNGGENI